MKELLTTQSFVAVLGMLIVAGTVFAVFVAGDQPTINQTVGAVLGTFGGGIVGFYFGASTKPKEG